MGFYWFFGVFFLYMDLCCFLKWISVAVYIRQHGLMRVFEWAYLGLHGLYHSIWACMGLIVIS
jgi:hypothetical protein